MAWPCPLNSSEEWQGGACRLLGITVPSIRGMNAQCAHVCLVTLMFGAISVIGTQFETVRSSQLPLLVCYRFMRLSLAGVRWRAATNNAVSLPSPASWRELDMMLPSNHLACDCNAIEIRWSSLSWARQIKHTFLNTSPT